MMVGQDKGTVDLLYDRFYSIFRGGTAYAGVEWKGIATSPVPKQNSTTRGNFLMFDGKNIRTYSEKGVPQGAGRVASTMTTNNSPQDLKDSYPTAGRTTPSYGYTKAYFLIEFDATKYNIQSGYLRAGAATAADFLSPDMFTSLNNLIIDGMMSKATGAIPINEIPEGSLLKINSNYYAAQGASAAAKEFVGYTPISGDIQTATLQNTSLDYAAENIRAGNQMLNISHFFENYKILDCKDSADMDKYGSSLKIVADNTLGVEGDKKYVAVNTQGTVSLIANPTATETKVHGAVVIQFQNYLLAYPENSTENGGIQKYRILSHAVSDTNDSAAADGAFSDVPFFENSVLTRGIAEHTSDILASGYQQNPLAAALREQLQRDFDKLFAGDLITLVRFILFLVLMWLVLAAWLCYACRVSNLMPILDTIRHPSGNQQQQGPDLMKLVSLGTITMDTEFGLGRFLQYNAILAVLLCVVMLTGRITT